jgi:hypothetical protein
VGTWSEGPKIAGGDFAFSADSKILAVETGSGCVRLVDPDTGREYARLEDPNQDRAFRLAFSTDGSQLVAGTYDHPAIHIWDLRAIRAELARRDLDWDLPAYPSAVEPKDAPPLRVEVVSQEQALVPFPVRDFLGMPAIMAEKQGKPGLERETAELETALAHVKLGRWDEAASDYALLAEHNPNDHWNWFCYASLCLQTGNIEGYRQACRGMLTRFGSTDKPEIAERTAKTCSLAPEAVSDFAPVLKLADRAVTGTGKHPSYRWFVLAKGLAEYRAGHYAAALDWLNRFSPRVDGVHYDATALAVLAMAKHKLMLAPGANATRPAEEAREGLNHAQAILSQKMPDPKAGRSWGTQWPYSVDNFHDWLHAVILTHEAEGLLKSAAAEKPQKER